MKKKNGISLFLAIICMLSMIWTWNEITAEASDNFIGTSPKFTETPQYLYEFVRPSASIKLKGTYAPKLKQKDTKDGPIISSVTHSAMPNETIVLEGSGMNGADVYMFGINKEGTGVYKKAEIISSSDTTISAVVSNDFANGMLLVWVRNQGGISYPVRINAPEVTYVSDATVQAGDVAYIYGENLVLKSSDNVGVYLVKGSKFVSLSIQDKNPYRLEVKIPNSVEAGNYKVYVHNGSGNEYGWSSPLEVSVAKKKDIWKGKTITVDGFTDEAIKTAISSADDYDTIYFKNGTYTVDSQIKVQKKLRFLGESTSGVKLVCGLATDTVGTNKNNNHIFLVLSYPSEFTKITFEDAVDKPYSPVFIWANGYSVKESREGFTVSNCYFGKNHSYGKQTKKSENEVGKCLSISTVTDVTIQNNKFITPSGAFITASDNIEISGNTAYGTWINDGENGACFIQFTSCNNIAFFKNQIYGQDILTDPEGKLDIDDKTFCRVLAFQLPYGATRNVYIADNTFDRVGGFIGNSGELIMFEAIYKLCEFKPQSVNGKTITLSNPTWTSVNGEMKVGTKPIKGATVVISNGRGNAQYRTITKVTANEIIVDRAWDIQPDTNSVVAIINPMENVVIYRNNITGPSNYFTQYNATAGVQAYASMLDFHVKDNVFKNVMTGVRLSSHYYLVNYEHFAVFEDTIVEDNVIQNVRYGIMMLLVFDNSSDVFKATEPPVHTSHNTIIRGNQISDVRYSTATNINGIGGDGITIGSEFKTYTSWKPNKIFNGAIITNTVVENNRFSHIANSCVRIQFNQGNTILRGNLDDDSAPDIAYDVSTSAGACTVIPPIEYTSNQSIENTDHSIAEEQNEPMEGQAANEENVSDSSDENSVDENQFNMKCLLIGEIILLVIIVMGIVIVVLRKYKFRKGKTE